MPTKKNSAVDFGIIEKLREKKEKNGNNQQTKKNSENVDSSLLKSSSENKKNQITKVIIKYDVGFNNSVYIRGQGANLNWNKGIQLRNVKADEWVWETDATFHLCEFKALINDKQFEQGENHKITCGASMHYTPKF